MQRAYWAALNFTRSQRSGWTSLGNRKPQAKSWMNYPIGRSEFTVAL